MAGKQIAGKQMITFVSYDKEEDTLTYEALGYPGDFTIPAALIPKLLDVRDPRRVVGKSYGIEYP